MNDFDKQALDVHNHYRSRHHAMPLVWNPSLAGEAQAWAERLAREDRLKHASTDDGENIYMSFGDSNVTGDVAVDKWYQEVKEYSFNRPGFQSNTGHFTQIVWRGSKELGVGKAEGNDGKVFVVARYRPPGNNLRTFEENVLPAQNHLPQRNGGGWELPDVNGNDDLFPNMNHSNIRAGYLDNSDLADRGNRYSERWDPVCANEKETPKRGSESRFRKDHAQQDPSKKTNVGQRWGSKSDDKGTGKDVSNRHPGGWGQDKFVNQDWDSGKWFDDDTIKATTNTIQQSSPEKRDLTDSSNVREKDKKVKSTTKGVSGRWQPKENQNQTKDPPNLQPWKGGHLQSKGYYRDSVDRNKSCNKVRASTEKWESLKSGEMVMEPDGSPAKNSKVGRNRTQESIKRWEEQNFCTPLPIYKPHRSSQSTSSLVQPRQSSQVFTERWEEQNFSPPLPIYKTHRSSQSTSSLVQPRQSSQVFTERWDPLWGDKPLNEDRPRPVSWDGGKFAEVTVDDPRERKITTTIGKGVQKTVVSALTITLKGNEGNLCHTVTKSKSTEDLSRPKSSYARHARAPVQEVYTEQRANRTNTRPKSQDFSSLRTNDWESNRPVEESLIIPVTKRIPDKTDGYHGYRDVTPRKTFPSLDHFSQQALDCHNVYRVLHGASNLMWSPEISQSAQQWAEKLALERTLRHSTRERGADGENLAMFTKNFENAAKEAIDMWYDEVKNYNFSSPGYQPRCGHFTQLVWKDSKEFGMGRAQTSDGQLVIVVSRYRPAGNILRQYELNVFPKVSFF